MKRLNYLAPVLLGVLALYPVSLTPQTPANPPSFMNNLNKEAEATDSAGIHVYSKHLVSLLAISAAGPPGTTATTHLSSFSDRLARAEESARKGKRKLILEEAIANAFNDLMQQTGAPSSLKADVGEVEKSRRAFETELPAIISESKNGKYCYPGESMWILGMLIENIGADFTPLNHEPQVSGYVPPALQHLQQYFSSHPTNEDARVMNSLAKSLGI